MRQVAQQDARFPIGLWTAITVASAMYLVVVLAGRALLADASKDGIDAVLAGLRVASTFLPIWLARRLRLSLLSAPVLYSLIAGGNLVIRSTRHLVYGLSAHAAFVGSEDIGQLYSFANGLSVLANLCLLIGYLAFRKKQFCSRQIKEDIKVSRAVLAVGLAIGFVATIVYSSIAGGWDNFVANITRGSSERTYRDSVFGLGQYFLFMNFAQAAALLWLADRKATTSRLLTTLFLMAGILVPFVQAGRRSAIIYTAFLYLIVWSLREQKIPALRTLLFIPAAIVIFGLIGELRQASWRGNSISVAAIAEIDFSNAMSSGFSEIEMRTGELSTLLPIIAGVPDETPLLLGEGYLTYFYAFVPRQIWQNKPRGMSVRAGETFYSVPWGIPPGAVGEAFWNFHIFGVILVFIGTGIAFSFLERWLQSSPTSPFRITFFSVCVVVALPPTNDGFTGALSVLIPVAILSSVARLKRRSKTYV
jgi:oligosaccharide repeat unit polymerase